MLRRSLSRALLLGALVPAVLTPAAAQADAPAGADAKRLVDAAAAEGAGIKRAVPTADGALVVPGTDRAMIAKLKEQFRVAEEQAPARTAPRNAPMTPRIPGGGQRHSLFFGAPAPMYLGAMTANGPTGGNGCLWELATDTPEAHRGNTRYITYGLSMDCTPSWLHGTGQARLMDAKDPLNPFGYHLGWAPQFNFRGPTMSYGFAGYNRPSDTSMQYIAGWFNAYVESGAASHGFTAVAGSDALECDPTGTKTMRCWFYTKPFPYVPDTMTSCQTGTVCDAANGALATAQGVAMSALAASAGTALFGMDTLEANAVAFGDQIADQILAGGAAAGTLEESALAQAAAACRSQLRNIPIIGTIACNTVDSNNPYVRGASRRVADKLRSLGRSTTARFKRAVSRCLAAAVVVGGIAISGDAEGEQAASAAVIACGGAISSELQGLVSDLLDAIGGARSATGAPAAPSGGVPPAPVAPVNPGDLL